MRALSTRIANIKDEMNPIPHARSTSRTPAPMRNTQKVFIQRKIRIIKGVGTTGASVNITTGDICKALGPLGTSESLFWQLDRVSAWNITNSGRSTNYLSLTLGDLVFGAASASNQAVSLAGPYEDYGAGGNPPSLSVNIPRALSSVITANPSGSLVIMTIDALPIAGQTIDVQTVVVDALVNVAF